MPTNTTGLDTQAQLKQQAGAATPPERTAPQAPAGKLTSQHAQDGALTARPTRPTSRDRTGRARSAPSLAPSMNALKLGIFSTAPMPWEDPGAREKIVRALRQEWQATTPTGELLVQQLASCTVQLSRTAHAFATLSANCYSDREYRRQYRSCVAHLLSEQCTVADWAYSEDPEPRKRAHTLLQVEAQLVQLRDHPTHERVLHAHRYMPDLWKHLSGSNALSPMSKGLMEYIGEHVSTGSAEQDVKEYLADFRQEHRFSLDYAHHSAQFDAARDYVRGVATLDLHSREHWQKTSARLHAQIERLHLQLLSMRRHRLESVLPMLSDQHSAARPGQG